MYLLLGNFKNFQFILINQFEWKKYKAHKVISPSKNSVHWEFLLAIAGVSMNELKSVQLMWSIFCLKQEFILVLS